ncbi:hypothetical protein D9M68_720920 [compost metagenome]
MLAGGVVQVHGEGVGEADGQLSEGVLRPGVLAQDDGARVLPIDAGRVERIAVAIQYAQLVLLQVGQVATDFRQFVLAHDGWRYGPCGVEGQAADQRLELRRLACRSSYLGATLP